MDMVLDLGAKVGAELILANDPDADRLAVSVLHDGRYIPLSGNEIGCLLAHYLLEQGPTVDNPVVISTIVSSPMLGAIAEFHNARWEQTLTGHKWIHNRAIELEGEAFNYVFGYEEALGYAPSVSVRDKDGVSSAVLLADAAAYCRSQGRTLIDELERMWSMYGLFMSSQVSRFFDNTSMIASAVESFRNDPPKNIGGIDVLAITDVKNGQRTLRDGTTSRIGLPSSNLLVYELTDGHRAMLRPSGTEPKLKYYFDVRVSLDAPSRVDEAKDSAKSLLERLANDLARLTCAKNGGESQPLFRLREFFFRLLVELDLMRQRRPAPRVGKRQITSICVCTFSMFFAAQLEPSNYFTSIKAYATLGRNIHLLEHRFRLQANRRQGLFQLVAAKWPHFLWRIKAHDSRF